MKTLLALLISLQAQAYFDLPASSTKSEMNGISYEKYKDFTKNWGLITVRYRSDNKELRFIYGNTLAMEHLKSGNKKPFPDGSILGKAAYITQQDPQFPSSLVPSSQRRFQFMVKDSKKYPETQGWGYALFDASGKVYKDDTAAEIKSCHACHSLVKSADFVFSVPMDSLKSKSADSFFAPMTWKAVSRTAMPPQIQQLVPKEQSLLDQYTGPLEEHSFFGTLDELTPALLKKTEETKKASLFLSRRGDFTLVVPLSKLCKKIYVYYKNSPLRTEERCEE